MRTFASSWPQGTLHLSSPLMWLLWWQRSISPQQGQDCEDRCLIGSLPYRFLSTCCEFGSHGPNFHYVSSSTCSSIVYLRDCIIFVWQLLALTIQQEKPELETEKNRLLQMEEEKKIQLTLLEETLLEVRICVCVRVLVCVWSAANRGALKVPGL